MAWVGMHLVWGSC